MELFVNKFLKGDKVIWIIFIGLCLVSALEMFSASSALAYQNTSYFAPMLRHVLFLFAGGVIVYLVHLIPLRYVRMGSYVLLIISIISLVLVLFSGIKTNDAARWLSFAGVQFQPSELAKLALIIVAADLIARIKESAQDEKRYFTILMVITGLIIVLIFSQNLSTAVLLFGVIWLMMFVGQIHWKKLTAIVATLMLVAALGYVVGKFAPQSETKPTQQELAIEGKQVKKDRSILGRLNTWIARVDRFFEDTDDDEKYVITDENRQIQNSKMAIALGVGAGKMPGNSVQRDFLTHAYSDFIYAIILEELGLFGGIVVMLLYLTLLFQAGKIATRSKTVFPAMLMIGLSLMIVLQAFVNMAVATGLGPVTGQPLPMISRGGTSTLITSIYFGIILSITRLQKEGDLDQSVMEEEVILLDDEDYEDYEEE